MTTSVWTVAPFTCALALSAIATQSLAQTIETGALQLETKIPLGDVRGRIDHMAIDLPRQQVFVAELENNSVGIVDLTNRKVIRTIPGLRKAWPSYRQSALFNIANAGDGSVSLFMGPDYAAAGQIDLGNNADNIRVDGPANRLYVGYGSGGLAVIDAARARKIADIPLSVHPEGFELAHGDNRIFVNLPEAQAIAVVDRQSGKQVANWPTTIAEGNFPMAIDQSTGHVVAVSCGEGFLDVLDTEGDAYRRIARVPTVADARTSLFIPELDRLLLAVRAGPAEPAAIWVFHPLP